MKTIKVTDARFKEGYTLHLTFSDGKELDVDFTPAITAFAKGDFGKYRTPRYFKQFKVENGNVVWGKNWDLIFPVLELHKGKISIGKTTSDKLKLAS